MTMYVTASGLRGVAAAVLSLSAVSVAVTAGVGDASAPPSSAASAPPSSAESVDLDAAIDAFVDDKDGGAVVLVVRDGVTTTAAAGVANSAGEAMSAANAFRVGSLSKTFVATIVLQLVDEGRVDLDEPLSTYLPDTAVGGDVRIRDLLRHRSGLTDYTSLQAFYYDMMADRARVFTPDDLLGYIADFRPGEPGGGFAYSSTNFILLGQLIEQLEGADLATVMRVRIADPLGLDITHLAMAGAPAIDGLAGGWSPGVVDGDAAHPYDSIVSGAWAAGAVVSTADELRTFLDALFSGELISDADLAEMIPDDSDGYGLGLGLLDLTSGTRLYGHDGDIFGYLSLMVIEPNTGDTLIILTNNSELHPLELAEPLLAGW